MSSIGSLHQTPKTPPIEESGPHLLELRTDAGAVYVCPSRWQRVRLQWAFRHFHVLPPQLLSRGDQRLIEKLSLSAVVTPALPVAGNTVFGVVEKVRSKSPASATQKEASKAFGRPETRDVHNLRLRQWAGLGALAAVGLTAILLSGKKPASIPQALPTPTAHAAKVIKPTALPPAAASTVSTATAAWPNAEKPRRRVAPPPPLDTAPATDTVKDTISALAPIVPSPAAERGFVSELPHGHFAHPVVSDPHLVGELQLRALIGADGLVKEVTVLSGSPQLAEAGMRAVRQWHYTPYQVLGTPAEAEAHIRMNFFGEDAVSISSVAGAPATQLK